MHGVTFITGVTKLNYTVKFWCHKIKSLVSQKRDPRSTPVPKMVLYSVKKAVLKELTGQNCVRGILN